MSDDSPQNSHRTVSEATRAAASHTGLLTGRLSLFFIALACLLLMRFFVPYFVERIQYAVTRGRQRAEVEVAEKALEKLPLEGLSQAYQLVSKRVGPSVVHINVRAVTEVMPNDEFAWLFGPSRRESQGQGSGVIIDQAGFVLTNHHVVEGATEIEVSLADGRVVSAEVIGSDAPSDLAVLRISAKNLIAAQWGDSDQLEPGALVWALGSPFGLEHSITFGILSAKNRQGLSNSAYLDFLQTDAAVNPGNSGGPLVDARGTVVGINTAILGDSYRGISFAIPSSVARDVYQRLKADGRLQHGWLGVSLADLDEQNARELGLPASRGAYVVAFAVVPNVPSPAERAGIRVGDLILSWNGVDVPDSKTLSRLIARTEVGAAIDVILLRRGQTETLSVVLGVRPRQMN
ncbi:MAG: trypsin-like peptidase domain-containing protein [Pirellulaceae bacterium]|jgi:S1-C subfamily serine protease|nr:trypsin-like peptidase domain-containing protein [Pirellulaceae bacterium]